MFHWSPFLVRGDALSLWQQHLKESEPWTLYRGSDQVHPQGKEIQKGKVVVWGAPYKELRKGEKLKAKEKRKSISILIEFQRIDRRDNKAFLSDRCKEIEENNRMGKTRDLFKKIRDTKGTFHAKMGSIKDMEAVWT